MRNAKSLEKELIWTLKPGEIYNSYKNLEKEKKRSRNVEYIILNEGPTKRELEKEDLLKEGKKQETKSLSKIGLSSLATIAYGIYEVANQNPSMLIFAPMLVVSNYMSKREDKINEINSRIEIEKNWRSSFDNELFSKMTYQKPNRSTDFPYKSTNHQF